MVMCALRCKEPGSLLANRALIPFYHPRPTYYSRLSIIVTGVPTAIPDAEMPKHCGQDVGHLWLKTARWSRASTPLCSLHFHYICMPAQVPAQCAGHFDRHLWRIIIFEFGNMMWVLVSYFFKSSIFFLDLKTSNNKIHSELISYCLLLHRLLWWDWRISTP